MIPRHFLASLGKPGNVQPTPTQWIDAATFTHESDSDGWAGYTGRVVIDKTAFSTVGYDIRLTATAHPTQRTIVTSTYLGIQALANPRYNYASAPKKVTWAGLDGFDLAAGQSIVSDTIDLTFNPAVHLGLVFGFWCAGGITFDDYGALEDTPLSRCYSILGNSVETLVPATMNQGLRDVVVLSKIEFHVP